MNYINTITNAYPVSEQEIRALYPNTSFPAVFVPPDEYACVFPAPPNHDPLTQVAIESAPELTSKGHWEQRWSINSIPAAIIAARVEAERLAAVPASVTRRQARQALLLHGKLHLVQAAIDAIPDATQRGMVQIEWDDSQVFERNRPTLLALAAVIGLDAAGLDALFIAAGAL